MSATPAVKYIQKDADVEVLGATLLIFFAFYLGTELLIDGWGELAILPAITLANSRPETRREWLLALLGAGLAAVLMGSGIAVGGWLFGYWPPTDIEGANNRLLVLSPGILPAVLILWFTAHSLGRKAVTPGPGDEKTGYDIGLWQGAAVVVAAIGATALLFILESAYLADDCGIRSSLPLQGMGVVLSCGGYAVLAWPAAGKRRAALLGRAGLGVAIVGASYPLGRLVSCLSGDWSSFAGFAGGVLALAIYIAAVFLGWWQLRHFARRHGMLNFPDGGQTGGADNRGMRGSAGQAGSTG